MCVSLQKTKHTHSNVQLVVKHNILTTLVNVGAFSVRGMIRVLGVHYPNIVVALS
jgi:hypothetical protein